MKKLLKNIDQKKSTGIDKIPPNLGQLSADILRTPLSNAINNNILKGKFLDDTKVASVSPLDKHTDIKYSVSNFRPVSVLNIFSKMYEKVLKNMLVEKMNDHFSPFVAANRENHYTQHVLIRLLEECRLYLYNNYIVGAVMTDLSKVFDCIPHDLLIAKLEAYGFDNYTIRYVYSYLKNRKQCVKINNTYSDLLDIISGVPQGSIVGPILFNIFFNDFFYVILIASAHNYADDNTLTSFGKTLEDLIKKLEHECEVALTWFRNNKMMVNPNKFQAILLNKSKSTHVKATMNIGNEKIESLSANKLLGIEIDDKLNFNNHINTICRSAANQLNALIRLRRFLGIEERKALIQSFVLSNFNYCPLVWMLSSVKSLNKIENLQKRALRFMLSDYESSYDELLRLSGSCAINVRLKRNLCVEIYKTLNDLNPSFMREIFETRKTKRAVRERYKINLEIPRVNQASFGTKSLRFYGPKIWNSLPYHIKSAENLLCFKNLIKSWNGSFCSCKVCRN